MQNLIVDTLTTIISDTTTHIGIPSANIFPFVDNSKLCMTFKCNQTQLNAPQSPLLKQVTLSCCLISVRNML